MEHIFAIFTSTLVEYVSFYLDMRVSFHVICTCQKIKDSYKYFIVMFMKYLSIIKLYI
jgi:hypothetical protein